MTTGHDVPAVRDRLDPTRRPAARRGSPRARTRTCRAAGRCAVRRGRSSACSRLSSGASNGVASPSRSATSQTRSRRPGRQPVRPRVAGEVERRDVASRRSGACGDRGRGLDDRARLLEPRQRRRERPPLPAAGRRRRTTRGASSAERSRTTNSSRPVRGGEPRRREPVDRRDRIAGLVRPRTDHVAACAAAAARQVAERETDDAPASRHERKRLPLAGRHRSQPAVGGADGARPSRARAPAPARGSAP